MRSLLFSCTSVVDETLKNIWYYAPKGDRRQMGVKQYDWAAIKTEYITGQISQADLAHKYGVSVSKLKEIAVKEKWTDEKKKYARTVVQKAVQKEANRQANKLAKELRAADNISNVLIKALGDEKQFNRWLTEDVEIYDDGGRSITTTEKIFEKVDMRSLKDAAATLKMVEQLKRSIGAILTLQEQTQLDIAQRKMALEEKKAAQDEQTDNTVTIRFESDDLKEWSE